jgi:hypothetical protein
LKIIPNLLKEQGINLRFDVCSASEPCIVAGGCGNPLIYRQGQNRQVLNEHGKSGRAYGAPTTETAGFEKQRRQFVSE